MSVDLPTEYGGAGQSFFASILVIEGMSKIDPSVGLVLDLQNTLLNRMVLTYGTEEQKQKYLPRMAKDLVLFSILIGFCEQRDNDECYCFRLRVFACQNRVREVMHLR